MLSRFAIVVAVVSLGGCAVGKNNRVGLATVNSQGDAVPAAATARVIRSGEFPASISIGGVEVETPLQLEDVQRLMAARLSPVEKSFNPPAPVKEIAPELEPTERRLRPAPLPTPVQCWVNPGGDAFHRDKACRFVQSNSVAVSCDSAMTFRRPCRTCGGK